MNAIDLMLADHEKVRKLLEELDKTTERGIRTREELFAKVKSELTVHEIIEEEIFYPTLRQHPNAKDIVLEGYEEHHVVDTLMGELSALPVDHETSGAKITVRQENNGPHVAAGEGELFDKARPILSPDELEQLGRVMEDRRAEARRELAV